MSIKPDAMASFGTNFLVKAGAPQLPRGYVTPFHTTIDATARLRTLGLDAAATSAIAVFDLTVETREDASGVPAHFFKYVIQSTDPFDGKKRMRLLRELRDKLLKQGDEHYPFVEINVR